MGIVTSRNKITDDSDFRFLVQKEKDEYLLMNKSSKSTKDIATVEMKEAINSLGSIHQVYQDTVGGKVLDFVLIVVPRNGGENVLIVLTDGSSRFYYANRTTPLVYRDFKKVTNFLKSRETDRDSTEERSVEGSVRDSITSMRGDLEEDPWRTFVRAIQSSFFKSNFSVIFTPHIIEKEAFEATLKLNIENPNDNQNNPNILVLNIPFVRMRNGPSIRYALRDILMTVSKYHAHVQGDGIFSQNEYDLESGCSQSNLITPKEKPVLRDSPSVADLQEMIEKKDEEIEKLSGQVQKYKEKSKKRKTMINREKTGEDMFDVPVQRVLDILQKWNSSTKSQEEAKKLKYIMKVIADESLYDVNVVEMVNKERDTEIKSWIESELLQNHKKGRWSAIKAYSKAIYFTKILKSEHGDHVYQQPELDIPQNIMNALEGVNEYDFDVFKLEQISNGRPLYYMALRLFEMHDLFSKFKIPVNKFREFLDRTEKGYLSNPYHNKIHAADVLQTLNYLVTNLAQEGIFDSLDVLSFLITAIMHDFNHPGMNNGFEIKTMSDRALLYNDQSVLENYHCTNFFRLIREDKCNFLETLGENELKTIRDSLIHMVLGTDMGQHFIILGQVRATILNNFDANKRDDKLTLMRLLIKCADVSNPTKALPVYNQWALRVTDEFFQQGDKEKELGLPVSPFMDRTKPNLSKSQVGFIDYICNPLFECLVSFNNNYSFILDKIAENRAHFQKLMTEEGTG